MRRVVAVATDHALVTSDVAMATDHAWKTMTQEISGRPVCPPIMRDADRCEKPMSTDHAPFTAMNPPRQR